MNFITRNLGWLLLLAFFIFMLFIISSSNPNGKTNSGTLNASGEVISEELGEDKLEQLAKKIDEEEKKEENKQKNKDLDASGEDKIISDESEIEEKTNEKGFFAKLFSRKSDNGESKKPEIIDYTQTGTDVHSDDDGHDHGDLSKHIVSGDNTTTQSSTKNLMKTGTKKVTSDKLVKKYAPEVLGYELPGVNLETKVGKNFDIGVHSLKINNKTFTKKLGFLMKGDTIQQISPANSYGCFEMEVLSSSIQENIGKTGYVCKKYLSESEYAESESVVEVETPLFSVKTTVGDIVEVNKDGVELGDIELSTGDKLDQMSEINENGCFIVRVYSSQIQENLGKTGEVCMSELY